MDYRCQLLVYLDRKCLLEDVQKNCHSYLEELKEKETTKTIPFRYILEIDVMDLLDSFPDLGKLLLKEPLSWRNHCAAVLGACLQNVLSDCDQHTQPTQVNNLINLNIRLKCVPKTVVTPNQHYFSGLVSFEGLVITVAKPSMYVYHSVWACSEDCEGSETVLQYTPKTPPKCNICRSVMFENTGLRRCGEQMTVSLLENNQMMPRTIAVKDDLIAKIWLGMRIFVSGVILKKTFTVWSVEEVKTLAVPSTMPIDEDISNLYTACNGIPWKFIYCLASSLGVNVCPLHCFMHLKIGLLMSLASVKSNALSGTPVLHVLLTGLDSSFGGKIMTEAAILADTQVFFSPNSTVTASLIASSGGVCVLPLPLHTYKQKQTSNLLSIIESNEIIEENQRVRLQCVVWAQGMDSKKNNNILVNEANVFGFVCRGDNGSADEIVEFLLQNSVDPQRNEADSVLRELRKYLEVVAGVNVSVCSSTEMLLRRYFLTARREKQRGVSVGSMNALVASTMTSARLCRRNEASIDDAVFAIWLHVSGSPEPRFAPEEYLETTANVKRFHKTMLNFKQWLADFIGCEL